MKPSAFADRVAKTPCKEPPIVAGHGFPSGQEEEHLATCDLALLSDHIKRFDSDPKIIREMVSLGAVHCYKERVREVVVKKWFKELRKVWPEKVTPVEATNLVMGVLKKLTGAVFTGEIQGFYRRYGLPKFKRSPSSSMKEPFSDEKEEHHGASAFANRVAKPHCKEPPIGGGVAGDGVSDSSASDGSNLSGDEPGILAKDTDYGEALTECMKESFSDEKEEHHGASAFAVPHTVPPISGGYAGYDFSDSSSGIDFYDSSADEGSNLSGDEPEILASDTDYGEALTECMKKSFSDEKEEHHGASAFAVPRTVPPIGSGYAGYDFSDSSAGIDFYDSSADEGSNLSGDEPEILAKDTDYGEALTECMEEEGPGQEEEHRATCDLALLSDHIKRFDSDPKIIRELVSLGAVCCYKERVREVVVKKWFKELRKVWPEKVTPVEATNLVMGVLKKLSGVVFTGEIQGFYRRYGLPKFKRSPSSR